MTVNVRKLGLERSFGGRGEIYRRAEFAKSPK